MSASSTTRAGSTTSISTRIASISPTARYSTTTCSSSRRDHASCPRRPRGCTGPGWMEKVFTFYDLPGATALEAKLATFEGGRLVVNVVDMPIKCPVAPLEFCFLADWYFHERDIRDRVTITYVTPLDGAFTTPTASQALGGMLEERGIELVTEFNTGEVDGEGGRLIGYDEREVPFDLAVVVPGAQRRRLRRRVARARRRPRLRADRRAHAAVEGEAERVRDRRRREPADLEGRVGDAFRGRDPRREHPALPARRGPRRLLRRPRQLLHRDRLPQGDAHRLQLRAGTRRWALPQPGRRAAAQGVAAQPPRQADVPVVLLARVVARS